MSSLCRIRYLGRERWLSVSATEALLWVKFTAGQRVGDLDALPATAATHLMSFIGMSEP
jgi:hypothetical protein